MDPLGLLLTGAHANVLRSLEKFRKPKRRMLAIDREMGAEPGSPHGFLTRIDDMCRRGKLTQEQYEEYRLEYMFFIGLGWYDAFSITPQAGFPKLKVDGRSFRADLVVCIPSNETWQLVVECDGYKHHSDKESFIRDRKRDRVLKSHGIDVLRFSGSEIYEDPAGVSLQLFDYLQKLSAKGE